MRELVRTCQCPICRHLVLAAGTVEKSVYNFLSYLVHTQTNKQKPAKTLPPWQM